MRKTPFDILFKEIQSIQDDDTLTTHKKQDVFELAKLVIKYAHASMKGAGPAPIDRLQAKRETLAILDVFRVKSGSWGEVARMVCPHCGKLIELSVSCPEE